MLVHREQCLTMNENTGKTSEDWLCKLCSVLVEKNDKKNHCWWRNAMRCSIQNVSMNDISLSQISVGRTLHSIRFHQPQYGLEYVSEKHLNLMQKSMYFCVVDNKTCLDQSHTCVLSSTDNQFPTTTPIPSIHHQFAKTKS